MSSSNFYKIFSFVNQLFFLAIIFSSISFVINGAEYYVAEPRGQDGVSGTGDDVISNDTFPGTFAQPFATFLRASEATVAGDTMIIRAGVYNETLRPVNSGENNKPVIIRTINSEVVTIKDTPGLKNLTQDEIDVDQVGRQYGIYLYDLSNVTIQGLSVTHVSGWVRVLHCDNIIIRDNKFTNALSSGTTGSIKFMFSDKNKVLNNTIHDGNDNLLLIHSDSNLVEGNNMMKGRHSLWCIRAGFFNVIKNNYFHNEIQKIGEIYDAENDPPLMYDTTKYNLVEGNEFAKTASSGNSSPYAGIQFAGQRCIIRKNLFYETVGPGLDLTLYSDEARYNYENRIYNNVFYKMDFAGVSISSSTSYTFHDNIFKNNILYASVFVANDKRWSWYTDELEGKSVQLLTGRKEGFIFENNNFFNASAKELYLITYGHRTSNNNPLQHEVVWWENNNPDQFKDNIEKNPLFVNATGHDFHLEKTSPMIDAGIFLTHTKGQGSGLIMPVADVKYFYSGFGISGETGDLIQLDGQEQTAHVVSINYDSSFLVIDKSLAWTDSQMVSLNYTGNAPDLGAYEYNSNAINTPHKDWINKNISIVTYQDPVNGNINITFTLPFVTTVKLSLYAINGKCIKECNLNKKAAGICSINLNRKLYGINSISTGVYLLRVDCEGIQKQTVVVFVK